MNIKAKPTPDHPNRMMVMFPSGHAVFNDREHAMEFNEHPGSIGPAARAYLATVNASD